MTNQLLLGQSWISKTITDFLGPDEPEGAQRTYELVARIFEKEAPVPAKMSPYEVFWSLEENWWMQIIDGRYHRYGPMVFDQGLHGACIEPGFLKSIEKACEFASRRLDKPPTTKFYKKLHQIACSHFDGKVTNMRGEQAGKFHRASLCKGSFHKILPDITPDQAAVIKQWSKCASEGANYETMDQKTRDEIWKKSGFGTERAYLWSLKSARNLTAKIGIQVADKIKQVNEHIVHRCSQLQIPPVAALHQTEFHYPWSLEIHYKSNCVKDVVEKLFENFSKLMAHSKSKDEKLRLIADLYQMLEWTHPFPDGQGRTDLVLLSKLLTENGFNPPILELPYFSTWSLLSEWTEYLKKGIEKWQEKLPAPQGDSCRVG